MRAGIIINENTRQVVLLDNFTQASREAGTLYIQVESLPIYLSTSIAFSIFSYKLRNYPRQVVWRAKNSEIIEVLESANLKIDYQYTKNTKQAKEEIELAVSNITAEEKLQPPKQEIKKLAEESKSTPRLTEKKQEDEEPQGFNFDQFTAQNLRSVDEGVIPENVTKDVVDGEGTQFDAWMKKIEATRSALDNLKGNQAPADRIRVAGNNFTQPTTQPTKRPKVFMFMSTLFSAAAALMAALILFPSSVYTLSITPPIVEDEISLSIPTSAFSKQTVTINEGSTKPTSGTENQETTRARGKVNLVNEGREPVILDGSDYYFDYNDARYVTLSNQTLPDSIVIPPGNTEPVSIDVQAANGGSEYNISAGERIEIYNLLGQSFCNDCYAVANVNIEAVESGQSKTVSLADQDVLRNTVDSLIAQKRVDTYIELASDTAVSDPSWYQNIDSTFVFNHGVGELADELNLKVDVNTNLFYLSKNELYKVLEQENSAASQIIDIDLQSTQGDFSSEGDIDITLLYRYKLKTDIDRESITDTLKEQDLDIAKEVIQSEFPSVKRIAKQETGVSIPGVSPRVNVNIVETK